MHLPHLTPGGGAATIRLREGGPVPACVMLNRARLDATYVSARHGIVFNTAFERLSFIEAGVLEGTGLDLGVVPLGPHATGVVARVCRMADPARAVMESIGLPPYEPTSFVMALSPAYFGRAEWAGIRRAVRAGWPVTVMLSSIRDRVVASARTYRMSAAFAAAVAADLDRHARGPRPSPLEVTASYMAVLGGPTLPEPAHWEDSVPVTRHASRAA